MNKEQEGLIELVGQEYTKWFYDNAVPSVSGKPILNGEGILTRGEFINKCKTDSEFSEKWGLTIEERELSLEERNNVYKKQWEPGASELSHDRFNSLNIPTKLITITYNDQKIENYEFWNKWMHV
jgi:hypothetical protein